MHFSGLSFYGGCEVATAVMHAYVMYRSHKHTVPTPFLNYVNPNIKRKNKPLKLIIFTSEFYVSLINSAEILNWKKPTKSCRWITERIYLHHLDKQFGLASSSVSVVRICCKIWFESHGRQQRLSQRPFRVFWQLLFFFLPNSRWVEMIELRPREILSWKF